MSQPLPILLVTVVPFLPLVAWGGFLFAKARRSTAWPLLPATIVESRVLKQGNTRKPRLAFDYQVAAQRHVGRRLWVGPTSISTSGDWADRVVARFPVGASVRVAVDPADASYAVLEPGLRAMHWLLLWIAAAVMGGGLVIAMMAG
jgi:hypothetical protein